MVGAKGAGVGCSFMAAWVREEEKASANWQKKREGEEADKDEVAPRVTVANLRRSRATLIRPTQGLPRLPRKGSLKILRESKVLYMFRLWVQMRGSCDPGERHQMARG